MRISVVAARPFLTHRFNYLAAVRSQGERMKALLKCVPAAFLMIIGFLLLTANVQAQDEATTFVYTNDNNDNTPNTVTAFSVEPGGALIPVPGSPFMTTGTGFGLGFSGSHRVTATITRDFLYAANEGSNDIGAFSIDPTSSFLTPVPGMPFATRGSRAGGISLAATPNGMFLYAGNFFSKNISAFRIGPHGELTPLAGSPFPIGDSPTGMKVTPNGKFLAVALPVYDSVAMFTISPSGALGSVTGSPFPAGDSGQSMDVDINCTSNLLFDTKFAAGTTVSVFTINSNGALSLDPTFTFTPANGAGNGSEVGVLSPDNQHLFVSNQFSNTITSLDVASGGSLSAETNSPFLNSKGSSPTGMSTNPEGTLLYVANSVPIGLVTGFHINGDGGLSSVMGSPFLTQGNGTGVLESLTVFPSEPVGGEGDEFGNDGHKGHFKFEANNKCAVSGEMEFAEPDTGEKMRGRVDAVNVVMNAALISGSGTLLDGTPLHYTALVVGNAPVIGANNFTISWVTSTGSTFRTSGALTDGYIVVHP